MNELTSVIKINERFVNLPIRADKFAPGNDEILFNSDMSPAKNTAWEKEGYTIAQFLSPEDNHTINNGIKEFLKSILHDININTIGFTLDQYHTFVNDEQHLQAMEAIRAGSDGTGGISMELFPVSIDKVDKRISEICCTNVTCRKTFTKDSKSYTVKHFWMRVVRPQHFKDNNPPHRDVHLERSRGAVNLYYPIAGSNMNSSLPILPGSHFWSEAEIVRTYGEAYVNDAKYTNPATVAAARGLNLITPNPQENEVMVFTPYAIHGGGYNFNSNSTRVSLEMRFWEV